jgi:hypothetical protein
LWRDREELRSEGRREEGVRWNDVCTCREGECRFGKDREELNSERKREEGIRWKGVCKCSRCV